MSLSLKTFFRLRDLAGANFRFDVKETEELVASVS